MQVEPKAEYEIYPHKNQLKMSVYESYFVVSYNQKMAHFNSIRNSRIECTQLTLNCRTISLYRLLGLTPRFRFIVKDVGFEIISQFVGLA